MNYILIKIELVGGKTFEIGLYFFNAWITASISSSVSADIIILRKSSVKIGESDLLIDSRKRFLKPSKIEGKGII